MRGLKAKEMKVIIDGSDVRSEWQRLVEVGIVRAMAMGKRMSIARNQELTLWSYSYSRAPERKRNLGD